ncbi:hypothetical protein CFT9_07546, partial [Pseudomonas sp. CFT9]
MRVSLGQEVGTRPDMLSGLLNLMKRLYQRNAVKPVGAGLLANA